MTTENPTQALLYSISERLGEQTATLSALQREVRASTEQTAAQLRDHDHRIDRLERERDERAGAAKQAAEDAKKALQRLDLRLKVVGALVALYGAAQATGVF